MNSRERVLAALEHRPVDRLPLGFFAVDHDTVSRVLGRETFLRHKAKSQIALWEGRRAEVAQSWKEDTIEFYRRIGSYRYYSCKRHGFLGAAAGKLPAGAPGKNRRRYLARPRGPGLPLFHDH